MKTKYKRPDAIDRLTQTEVHRIEYDCLTKTGRIIMADGCCTDMPGAIRLFELFAPEVQLIETFQLDQLDTFYRREPPWWASFRPDGVRMWP